MDFEQILEAIKNVGVPVVLLGYFVWRDDKFLRHLTRKLDKFNDELSAINLSLRDLIDRLKK